MYGGSVEVWHDAGTLLPSVLFECADGDDHGHDSNGHGQNLFLALIEGEKEVGDTRRTWPNPQKESPAQRGLRWSCSSVQATVMTYGIPKTMLRVMRWGSMVREGGRRFPAIPCRAGAGAGAGARGALGKGVRGTGMDAWDVCGFLGEGKGNSGWR